MSDSGVGGLGSYEQMFGQSERPSLTPVSSRWQPRSSPNMGRGTTGSVAQNAAVSIMNKIQAMQAQAGIGRGIAVGRNLGGVGGPEFLTDASLLFELDDPAQMGLPLGDPATNRAGRVILSLLTEEASTHREILAAALQLEAENPELVEQLQMEMLLGGLLTIPNDQTITGGVLDDITLAGLRAMADGKAARPSMSWDKFFDTKKQIGDTQIDDALAQLAGQEAGQAQDLADALSSQLVFSKSDPLAIRQGADEMARQLMGNTMDPAQLDEIVNAVHAKERELFYGSAEYQNAKARIDQYTSMTLNQAGASDDELDRFMTAIETIESSGNPTIVNPDSKAFGLFQFTPSTWAQETARFKLDPNDRSAENQRRVAAAAMSRYYQMFGDWRRVAVAWYAGEFSPHVASGGRSSTNKQGEYISIDGYATKAMELMGGTRGTMKASLSSNPFMSSIGRAATKATEAARNVASMDGDPMATLNVTEQQDFDLEAYVRNLVEERGGLDMNSYQFLQHALTFEDLIRGSI